MTLTQYHHGSRRIRNNLVYATDPGKAGLRASTARSQYNVLIGLIVEYLLILLNDYFRNPHLFLFLLVCH